MNKEYLIYKLSDEVKNSCKIDKEAFTKFNVKRGLRNDDGSGVLVGLTNIGNVVGYERDADGKLTPTEGKLYYRGYELDDLVSPLLKEKRFGFEEVAFLLLSGQLPDKEELEAFKELLNDNMPLDHRTITHIIELEGSNIMNILARCVLEMYTFDPNPDDISRDNLMRQSIELIAKFPTIIAYAYNIYRHSVQGRSLHIRHPRENLSIAENFLYMMKHENYSELDARMLDLLLIIQAEHGGGNNSTFTVRVTSSTRTDTYSSIAAGIGSLKGSASWWCQHQGDQYVPSPERADQRLEERERTGCLSHPYAQQGGLRQDWSYLWYRSCGLHIERSSCRRAETFGWRIGQGEG